MGRDMGDDHPKQDTQLVDLLRRILGNLDVGDSIGSRKRDEERYVPSTFFSLVCGLDQLFGVRSSTSIGGAPVQSVISLSS